MVGVRSSRQRITRAPKTATATAATFVSSSLGAHLCLCTRCGLASGRLQKEPCGACPLQVATLAGPEADGEDKGFLKKA